MTRHISVFLGIGLASTVAWTTLSTQLRAEPPEVIHYLAEFSSPDPSVPCADFESDSSRRIVASKGGAQTPFPITFLGEGHPAFAGEEERYRIRDEDGNLLLDLFETTWVAMPVVHVTDSGAEKIEYILWLQQENQEDNARPGTTSKTGPDGDVFGVTTVWINQLPSSDSFYPLHWYITTPQSANAKLCISVGSFNK